MPKNALKTTAQREGRLLLAVNAIKKGQITKIREAARTYDVPFTTLRARLRGRPERSSIRAHNIKLSETEEESLKKWIISMNRRGAAPRPSTVQIMADLLLSDRGDDVPALKTGKNWVSNFLRRNKTFKTKFICKYNYQRAGAKIGSLYVTGSFVFKRRLLNMGFSTKISIISTRLASL